MPEDDIDPPRFTPGHWFHGGKNLHVKSTGESLKQGRVTMQYQGRRTYQGSDVNVTTDGRSVPLNPRLDLVNHSPTGFEWGYGGSGPSQLALAILAHCLKDDDCALSLYQSFKWEVVAHLPYERWTFNQSNCSKP